MMLVPRSFLYTSTPSTRWSSRVRNEKDEELSKPQGFREKTVKRATVCVRKPARISSAPLPKPSSPVIIPTRARVGAKHRTKEKTVRSRASLDQNDELHNPQLLPPSVAALLAVTSLPKSKHHFQGPNSGWGMSHRVIYHGEDTKNFSQTFSNTCPRSWEALLSPPDELEQDNSSVTSDGALDSLFMRSLSSESMPSLEADMDSSSSISNPSTAGEPIGRRYHLNRRPRTPTTVLSEDSILEHPLLISPGKVGYGNEGELSQEVGDAEPGLTERQLSAAPKFSFKSNLTASLRRLRSAAVSFSNFTAPVIQSDDYLANPLLSLSSHLTDERRPLPSTDVPNPELRRYLNPIGISPAELYFHQAQPSWSGCTASIQMQTLQKGDRISAKATAPPIFASCPSMFQNSEPPHTSFLRQREPRENSDFLRVFVLEMEMRKHGKIADTEPGRAKLWLPPRRGLIQCERGEETGIPKRWVGVAV